MIFSAVSLQKNENTVMVNNAAINSTEVKTMRNSKQEHLFFLLLQIFK